jgi:AmmeMemoRadiSam system protein B
MTAQTFVYQEDRYVIDRMLTLDAKGLYEVVRRRHLTMCGVLPTTVALLGCQELGATAVMVVRYMTSGDINGDLATVVGYAGLLIT